MKAFILVLALLAAPAFAGSREIINPDQNGDIKVIVNKSGTATEAMLINGTSALVRIGVTGEAGKHTVNGGMQFTLPSAAGTLAASTPGLFIGSVGSTVEPYIQGESGSAGTNSIRVTAQTPSASDTGTEPLMRFDSRLDTAASVVTRPLFAWRNFSSDVGSVAADGAWALGLSATRRTTVGASGLPEATLRGDDNSYANVLQLVNRQGGTANWGANVQFMFSNDGSSGGAATSGGDIGIIQNRIWSSVGTHDADFIVRLANGNTVGERLRVLASGAVLLSNNNASPAPAGFFTFAVTPAAVTTCDSACSTNAATFSFITNSGWCMAAWNGSTGARLSGGTNGCTDATSVVKRCMCSGLQ